MIDFSLKNWGAQAKITRPTINQFQKELQNQCWLKKQVDKKIESKIWW